MDAAVQTPPSHPLHRNFRGAISETMLTGLVAQGLLLVSSVMAARLLGAEDRGYLALIAIWPTTLVLFGSLGAPVGITYLLSGSDNREAREIRGAALLLTLGLGLILTSTYALGLTVVGRNLPPSAVGSLWLAALAIPALTISALLNGVTQAVPNLRLFNLVRTIPAAGYALGLLLLALMGQGSLEAIAATWVSVQLLAGLILTVVVFRLGFELRQPRRHAYAILRYGAASYIGALGTAEIQRLIEQIAIALLVAADGLGLWVVAVAVVQISAVPARSIRMVAFPDIARSSVPGEVAAKTRRYLVLTVLIVGVLTLAIVATSGLVLPLVCGDEFEAASTTVRILAIAVWLHSIRRLLGEALRGAGSPRSATLSEGVNILLLIALLIPATRTLEVEGAAIAVLGAAAMSLGLQLATLPAPLTLRSLLGRNGRSA